MKPFKVKTNTGQERWYWLDGASIVEVDPTDVPALIQTESTAKLVRAIERLQAEVSPLPRRDVAWPSRWIGR